MASVANSMFQRIARYCELAASQQLLCLPSAGGAEDTDDDTGATSCGEENDDDDTATLWVKTSMERLEHFMQTQKYSHYISSPVHLEEYANNMIVEQMLMSEVVKDLATELRNDYLEMESEIPLRNSTNSASTKAFGRASRGDAFFSESSSNSSADPDKQQERSTLLSECESRKRTNKASYQNEQPLSFSPSVKDYFSNEIPGRVNTAADTEQSTCPNKVSGVRSDTQKASSAATSKDPANDDFPPSSLGNFVRQGMDPVRVADRKYQIQDDAVNAFLSERKNQQVIDSAVRNPNLVDKSREFLIEVTVYGQADSDDSSGIEQYSSFATYKVEVLGSQTLADLRDALLCDNDFIFTKELEHPGDQQNLNELAKNKLLSAMLLIDNTIYNDNRFRNNFDYASQIIRWTRLQPIKKAGPFKRGDMSITKLKNLTIQFGFPYLFRHLGDCEHVIVFNKARLLTDDDEHRVSHFPRISWISDMRPKLCRIDNKFIATWAVLDYEFFPESPMLVCTDCLKEFCYTKNAKRGPFRLFPYLQLICEIPLCSEQVSKSIKMP